MVGSVGVGSGEVCWDWRLCLPSISKFNWYKRKASVILQKMKKKKKINK